MIIDLSGGCRFRQGETAQLHHRAHGHCRGGREYGGLCGSPQASATTGGGVVDSLA